MHSYNLLWDIKKLPENTESLYIRFPDLQHTTTSLLLNQSVPVIEASRRKGHSRASITLDVYFHLLPSIQSAVEGLIDDLVMPVAVPINQEADKSVDYYYSRLQQKLSIQTITTAVSLVHIHILKKSPTGGC